MIKEDHRPIDSIPVPSKDIEHLRELDTKLAYAYMEHHRLRRGFLAEEKRLLDRIVVMEEQYRDGFIEAGKRAQVPVDWKLDPERMVWVAPSKRPEE